MKTSDFNYHLPVEYIAQKAIEPRDSSRLMVLDRKTRAIEHRQFFSIVDYLQRGDILVCNDSRVIPARLKGYKADGGAKIELFLLRRVEPGIWEALAKPARRLKKDSVVAIGPQHEMKAKVLEKTDSGTVVVELFNEDGLYQLGNVPLPPYIRNAINDPERYQTVYSRHEGSVAAPTAGLHFTRELIDRIQARGVQIAFVTLHLALDSFRPVTVDNPRNHVIHKEYGQLRPDVVLQLNKAKNEGRRIVCVGTSSVRMLEYVAQGKVHGVDPFLGWNDLFILPGHTFRMVDAMITNFHLPCSTLIMLVSAFAGSKLILTAYNEAIRLQYRFYSFGDSMLIL